MDSIRDGDACRRAAQRLKQGIPIGTYIRGVCGLWADGQREDGLDQLYRIKGERRGSRPVGTTLTSPQFTEMLNPAQISPSVKGLILSERELVSRLGSLCFIRAPVRDEVGETLPDRLVSRTEDGTYWIQNWLPEGCTSAAAWMNAVGEVGITLPVATSMNISGKPEIVDQDQGREFCGAHDVPIFLADPESPGRAKGSFPIIQVDREGITLVREGHFPAILFRSLLTGWSIDLSDYQHAKFRLIDAAAREDEPADLRRRLIRILDG